MTDKNNASGLSPLPYNDAGLFLLPTRGEKRIIPFKVEGATGPAIQGELQQAYTVEDFILSAALSPFVEYVLVRIPGRGVDSQGNPDPTASAYYQFLINPESMQVNRQQVQAQSLARGGWQNGVWGEDFLSITMEGKTPGSYFADGLTDLLSDYSVSYRNLAALELVVENNGYWFEGEQAAEGPLAADFSRRQIKMHSDVELTVGEFVWYGMFESLDINEDSGTPYLDSFSLTFTAWREHYRKDTPYPNPIGGSVDRGHIPDISLAYGNTCNPAAVTQTINNLVPVSTSSQLSGVLAGSTPAYISPLSAGLITIGASPNLPATDFSPVSQIMSPTSDEWNLI